MPAGSRQTQSAAPGYYPALLDLRGRRCVVLGGGRVAERKAAELLRSGACPVVISPLLTARLTRMLASGRIKHIKRTFRPSDLKAAFLVIAATGDARQNRLAASAGVPLVNIVDDPAYCSFIAASVIRRGPLLIAVSTSGSSPALAREIRLRLERVFGPAFGRHLSRMRLMRAKAMLEISDPKKRMRYLKSLAADTIESLMMGQEPVMPDMPKLPAAHKKTSSRKTPKRRRQG